MKNLKTILLSISVLANLGMLYFFFFKGNTHTNTQDSRTSILIPKQDKEFVLKEMRGFLETVEAINEGILENNPQKIAAAAKKSGGAATEHIPPSLRRALPMEFKKLGFNTHDKFDELAETVQKQFNKEKTQEQLGSILNNCTSCHRMYKLDVQP